MMPFKPITDSTDESDERLFQSISAIWLVAKLHMTTREKLQQEIRHEKNLLESLERTQS